jgi:hypothetical protein
MEMEIPSESWSRLPARIFSRKAGIPVLFHALVVACLVSTVILARYALDYYSLISQEDHEVEWSTVVFYLAAGLIGLIYAFRLRRPFDALVALICLCNCCE